MKTKSLVTTPCPEQMDSSGMEPGPCSKQRQDICKSVR